MIYLIEVFNRDTQEWNPSHLVPPFATPELACESLRFLAESDPGSLRRIRAYFPGDSPVFRPLDSKFLRLAKEGKL